MLRKMLLFCLIIYFGQCLVAQDSAVNDHIFPAAAAARPFIDFDARGFLVKGKRTFIVSAGMEYARVPRDLWKDRLLRLKRAGFNTIEIYTFWNFHEEQEGKFNFTGDHDLDHFLKIVRDMGMYCIARVGPYYCAEWDQGGYPLWLRFKRGLRVREPNDTFQHYVGRFFDHLLPIVRDNQISRGGSVIMVQLENEHTRGWGTVMPDRYFTFLRQKAISGGIEVPYFFSGLHHDTDPAGDQADLDDSTRPNPWMSTEFWAVWFNQYGAKPGDADKYERYTRKIIARGGNGYNYYMAHGGSNFGYTNNDEDAASYDYGAALGQAGDLRPLYYRMKRCAYFATGFSDVLENSHSVESRLHTDTSLHITERASPAGDIIFVDNPGHDSIRFEHNMPAVETDLPNSVLTIGPGEIVPILSHYPLSKNQSILWSSARVLGIQNQGNTRTLVCYGEPGSAGSVFFSSLTGFRLTGNNPHMTVPKKMNGQGLFIQSTFWASAAPEEFLFEADGLRIRILFESTRLADRTWFLEAGGEKYVVCGPLYPGNFSVNRGRYSLQTEVPLGSPVDPVSYPVRIYSSSAVVKMSEETVPIKEGGDTLLRLTAWTRSSAAAPAAPGYDDSHWTRSVNPAQMGMDGHAEPQAWYRTVVDVPDSGLYKLECSGGDRASVFVDGKWALTDSLYKGAFLLRLPQGRHLLALYTAHDGRDKLPGYTGPLDSVNAKGLSGEVWLKRDTSASPLITQWRFIQATDGGAVNKPVPDSGAGWSAYATGADAFAHKTGYGWFETRIEKPAQPVSRIELLFKSVDEDATVFVAGKQVAVHRGWNQPFKVPVTVSAGTRWPLQLDVFIENHSNEGGIDQPVTVEEFGSGDMQLKQWRMQGGTPEDPQTRVAFEIGTETANSSGNPLNGGAPGAVAAQGGAPAYYRASFSLPDTAAGNTWRVNPDGLDHGYVWVNGHNLGHYPEKIDAPGLYIPGTWLKKGDNEVIILDESGAKPGNPAVVLEQGASRSIKKYFAGVLPKSVLKKDHVR